MKIAHYEELTGKLLGWYDKDIHKTIPTPNIEVKDEIWQEAINIGANAYINGKFVIFDFRTIDDIKKEKTNEINKKCSDEITAGFKSNALGSEYIYQSEQIDQLNLIGVVTAGQDDYFKCGVQSIELDENNQETIVVNWDYKMHTIAQLQNVLKDGKAIAQTLLQKANALKVQVANATTIDEVNAIQW